MPLSNKKAPGAVNTRGLFKQLGVYLIRYVYSITHGEPSKKNAEHFCRTTGPGPPLPIGRDYMRKLESGGDASERSYKNGGIF